jgi:Fic family protein
VPYTALVAKARVRFAPDQPFDDLPELPPKIELETPVVLRACIRARAALAELNAAVDLIPNPAILINTIPILEAQASSEIENIITTAQDLFKFADDDTVQSDPAIKEALRYRAALERGTDLLKARPLSVNLAIEVCTVLRGIETQVRRIPGTALRNLATRRAVYTPPLGAERLRNLLSNWEKFMHDEGRYDPLVRMAVGHYQFEAIHPFEDGNGRTGRILNLLFLVEQDLLARPILYMSGQIIRRRADYYRLLQEVSTSGKWEAWLLYMLRIVEETSRSTVEKIRAMRRLFAQATEHIRREASRVYSHELVDLIFERPYCQIADVVERGLAKRQTASEYLATLVDIGVLHPEPKGRAKSFAHRALVSLLASTTNKVAPYRRRDSNERVGRRRDTKARQGKKKMRVASLDEQLRFAIANKRLLELTYNGALRVVEPHDYGVNKNVTRLLAYQLRQRGVSGRKILSGWRLLDVSKIEKCDVLETAFQGSRGEAHERHYQWEPLYARVS